MPRPLKDCYLSFINKSSILKIHYFRPPVKGEKRHIWIEAGYKRFASQGETGLTIESIARDLGKNKSSFYHYFGELQVLKSEILTLHIDHSKEVGNKISAADQLDPDVLDIILEHKIDFLFHKQLKLEHDEVYQEHYKRAYAFVEAPLIEKLSSSLGLQEKQLFSSALLSLVSDNFLLRIQDKTLTLSWLRDYLQELRALTRHVN